MEPGDPRSKQSVKSTAALPAPDQPSLRPNHHHHHHTPSASYARPEHPASHQQPSPRDRSAMATATVLAPSAHYHPPPPSYSSGFRQTSPPNGQTTVRMNSTASRRQLDDGEPSTRQSLPSISEVISGARPQFPPPTSMQAAPSLPPHFSQPSHQYAEPDHQRTSPPRAHSTSLFPSRPEGSLSFNDSPRPPFAARGGAALPSVADHRPTPPIRTEIAAQNLSKTSDHHPPNGLYSHTPPPEAPPAQAPPPPRHASTSHPYQPNPLPAGQVPLPGYPISPRHAISGPPAPYDPRGHMIHAEEAEYLSRGRLDPSSNLHFEPWSYQESLTRIGSSSRTIFNFAEAYSRIAREQHGSQPIPERLPTEREVSGMLANVDVIKRSLEHVKDAVQASIQNERYREGLRVKTAYDDDQDIAMYGDGMKSQYAMQHEVKKRRGRAAPPGRCHSCNRIDTPEWRRGPDGARTLCNACGLHYAKLERKRQLEARSIRPKPDERD